MKRALAPSHLRCEVATARAHKGAGEATHMVPISPQRVKRRLLPVCSPNSLLSLGEERARVSNSTLVWVLTVIVLIYPG